MRRSLSLGLAPTLALTAVLFVSPPADAQNANSGAAAAAEATPRMANGKPSLAGMWVGTTEDVRDFIPVGGKPDEKGNLQEMFRARPCHPGMKSCHAAVNQSTDSTFTARMNANRPLYKPEFWDRVQYLDAHTNWEDPVMTCVPQGIPRVGAPRKIMQTDNEVLFLYGSDFRIIPTDGRPHDPIKSQDLFFNGHAVGRWEGDTLVVARSWRLLPQQQHEGDRAVPPRGQPAPLSGHRDGSGRAPRAVDDGSAGPASEPESARDDRRADAMRGAGSGAYGGENTSLSTCKASQRSKVQGQSPYLSS
jgi:hypothetical protein